jgi:hypothetical protein
VVGRFRAYGLAASLAAAGVALVAVGGLITKETAGAAGLLFVGAALARAVDVYREQRSAQAQDIERRRSGLDETRRLLLMIRMSIGEPSPELVASVVNALVHHHAVEIPADELMFRLMRSGRNASDENKRWLQDLIDEITRRRDALW